MGAGGGGAEDEEDGSEKDAKGSKSYRKCRLLNLNLCVSKV